MGRSGQTRGTAAAPQRTATETTVKLTAANAAAAGDVLRHYVDYLDDYGDQDYSSSWAEELKNRCQAAISRAETAKRLVTPADAYLIFSAIDRERDYMDDYGAADYTPAELKRKEAKLAKLADALNGQACTSEEFFFGAGECDSCGKMAVLDRHGELCPECVESEGEKCVFCGDRYPADEFEDGLRCRHCQEEDDKPLCANCGAEIDEAGSIVFCVECREDDTVDE